MHLKDLKQKTPAELVAQAEEMGVLQAARPIQQIRIARGDAVNADSVNRVIFRRIRSERRQIERGETRF